MIMSKPRTDSNVPHASEARDGFGAALAATGGRASLKPPSPCILVPHKEMGGNGVSGSTSRRSSPAQSATGKSVKRTWERWQGESDL